MTNEEERYFALAEEYATYNDLSLKAMALLANEHKKSATAMRVFSFQWKRNARNMAKAVDLFEKYFIHEGYTAQDYLTLFAIASVGKFERGMLYEDWRGGSLNAHEVQKRVADLKAPKPKHRKPDLKQRVCELIQELERANHNGAEMIVTATKQAIAARLRELIEA